MRRRASASISVGTTTPMRPSARRPCGPAAPSTASSPNWADRPGGRCATVAEDRSVLSRSAGAADRVLAYGEDPGQIIEVRDARDGAAERPLVLIIHGGFWR